MIDVTGNNIANVNTAGFKSGAVVFQDILSQTMRGAGAPATAVGGTNPAQVGLGVTISSVVTNLSQGAMERTNRPTDVAIEGDGYFMLDNNGQQLFTRNGAFSADGNGMLVSQEGAFVMGWQGNAQTGVINTNTTPTPVKIPVGQLMSPAMTTTVTMGGNLPGSAPIDPGAGAIPAGAVKTTTVNVYDAVGTAIPVTLTWLHTGANTWRVSGTYLNGGVATSISVGGGSAGAPPAPRADGVAIQFSSGVAPDTQPAGELEKINGGAVGPTNRTLSIGGVPSITSYNVDLGDLNNPNRVTQFNSTQSLATLQQDGSPEGSLERFSIAQDGTITGSFSNGKTQNIGQLAMALFTNPEGLEKAGGNNLSATVNSGLPEIGVAGQGGRGLMGAGQLEMSNVDLAQEFTNLIVGQRGFQANSRVITTSDELLQELVNLKR